MSNYPRPNKELIESAPDKVTYKGKVYRKDGSGYYRSAPNSVALHRVIWEETNGPIPEGYQIHHIDRNPTNNDVSNLMCVSVDEHIEIHRKILTQEERDWSRDNLINNANPASKAWHRSEKGRQWHREHALQNRANGCYHKELICSFCGKHYIGEPYSNNGNHFCSNKCKVAYRRASGIDDEPRVCECCGKTFMANKRKGVKTCSKECRYKMVSKRLSERANNIEQWKA